MYCTIFAFLIAAYLAINPAHVEGFPDGRLLGIVFTVISFLCFFVHTLIRALAWKPLLKAEYNLTPHIMEMYQKDFILRLINGWLPLFPLVTLLFAADLLVTGLIPKNYDIALWVIFLGITLDGFHYYLNRFQYYLNPFTAVNLFTDAATASIKDGKEPQLMDWIDGLSEISLKAVSSSNTALGMRAIDQMPTIAAKYLNAQKSIAHIDDEKTKGVQDEISYILFYLFQRLDLVNEQAVDKRFENISSGIVTVLSKIALSGAKLDMTLTSYPLYFIGKAVKKAQENNLNEVPLKASFALVKVARGIIEEIDISYADLIPPFYGIINHLDAIAKDAFKRDKKTNLQILTQPLRELKELLSGPKFVNHRDADAINRRLQQVIDEWDALAVVLMTMPPMPKINPETPDAAEPTNQ